MAVCLLVALPQRRPQPSVHKSCFSRNGMKRGTTYTILITHLGLDVITLRVSYFALWLQQLLWYHLATLLLAIVGVIWVQVRNLPLCKLWQDAWPKFRNALLWRCHLFQVAQMWSLKALCLENNWRFYNGVSYMRKGASCSLELPVILIPPHRYPGMILLCRY